MIEIRSWLVKEALKNKQMKINNNRTKKSESSPKQNDHTSVSKEFKK